VHESQHNTSVHIGSRDAHLYTTDMYPLLFQMGPLKLYTYGLMMAIGFLAAIQWAAYRAPRYKVSPEFISNLSIWLIVAGIVGGRVSFLAFEESPADIFSFKFFEIWKGGMVFYGGFIAAVIASIIYARKKGVSFFTVADIISPALALGHFFGRIGCTFAGCCFGKQCDLPWAITFHNPLSLAPLNIPLHPTQLYDAFSNLLIIGILLLIERKRKTAFRGQIFILYLALYAIGRSIVEEFRGDSSRGFVDFWGIYPNEWLSTSTFIGLCMLATAIGLYFKQRNQNL
jgi:phosphatidylglycerol:prolipoprotein diacylglycerol transferase